MSPKAFDRMLLIIAIMVGMVFLFAWTMARSQTDVRQSNDQNLQTTGDVSTGSKNLAIGLGMGDVDIADCMYTKSTPVYQWGTINKWCAADAYDRKGQHDNAARMRCSIRLVKNMYKSNAHCIVMNTLEVVPDPPPIVIQPVDPDDDDDHRYDEQIEKLTEQLVQYGQQQQQVEQRQQIQQQQYEKVQQYENARQRKLDLIKQEFGDDGT